jgi:alkylation response protein AidB-like acyl-CoA dehydrogenase
MDFDLSEEQQALADSLGRLLADRYTPEARLKFIAEPGGFSRARWEDFVALGLAALPFGEDVGGLAGGPVETMLVMQAFGRALVVEPYLASIVLGGSAVQLGGSEAQRARILPGVAAGSTLLALAHAEPGSRFNLADVSCAAHRSADGWTLSGVKVAVLAGDSADLLIVAARHAGASRDPGGIGLFLVAADAAGLERRGFTTLDGHRAAELRFSATPAEPLGAPEHGFATLTRTIEHGITAASAEALGVMETMHAMTLDYLKTRKQFGRAIGEFQVLQHRAVDMFVALEQARSMVFLAAGALAIDDGAERARAIHAAKVQVSRSLTHIAEEAVQLHGGIGTTLEYFLGHLVRRATVLASLFGDADHHLRRLAALGGVYAAA